MVQILILTKRSVLLVFLVTTTFGTAFAGVAENEDRLRILQEKKVSLSYEVTRALVAKGLHEESAKKKTSFLHSAHNAQKLDSLLHHEALRFPKEKVIEKLTRYALHDTPLNLDSYHDLVGFAQSINPSLNKTQLAALSCIAKA